MNNDLTKKYYTIGQVSEILDIPAPTLRYWEKRFAILRPHRNQGQQRRYTPDDIEKIRMVNYLVKERGLHIDAAIERLNTDANSVARHAAAVNRLRDIRNTLDAMLATITPLT